ncbi:MAG: hypothetical protein OER91_13050, partial [Gammaproteobacteria bacterium]|nr:hypothetical protein [Gammaproteobacteria bacterium]
MNRFRNINLAALTLAVCLASPVADAKKNTPAGKPAKVDVIMVYDGKPDKAEKQRVNALGAETKREFKNFNMRVLSVPETALQHLGKGKGVRFVAKDAPIESFSVAARQTAGQPAAGTPNAFGVDSTIGIAVLDSGVSVHKDLNVASRVNCTIPGEAVSGYVADYFETASYSNNDGTANWSGAWVEENDDGSATSTGGDALVWGPSLYMDNYYGGALPAVRRTADLESASSATLSFDYTAYGAGGLDIVAIEVSSNGDGSYTTLE